MRRTIVGVPEPVREILTGYGLSDLAHGIVTYDEISPGSVARFDVPNTDLRGLRLNKRRLEKINAKLRCYGVVVCRRVSPRLGYNDPDRVFYSLKFFCSAQRFLEHRARVQA